MRVWKRRVFVCGFQSKEEGRKERKKKKSRMHTRIKKSSIIPIWLDLPKRCRKLTPRRKERGKRVRINNEKQMASRANPQVRTWQRKEKQIRFGLWTLQALIYGRFCSCGTLTRKHGIGIQPYYEIQFSLPLQASHPWDRTSLSVERRQTRHVAWYVEPSHLHGYLLLCMMMRRTSLFGPALKIMYSPSRNKICAKICPWASRSRVKKRLESQKIQQQKSKIFLSWMPSWSFFSRLFISPPPRQPRTCAITLNWPSKEFDFFFKTEFKRSIFCAILPASQLVKNEYSSLKGLVCIPYYRSGPLNGVGLNSLEVLEHHPAQRLFFFICRGLFGPMHPPLLPPRP